MKLTQEERDYLLTFSEPLARVPGRVEPNDPLLKRLVHLGMLRVEGDAVVRTPRGDSEAAKVAQQ